ncbi:MULTISPECIES: hypothetical protein [Bradyrhizobium]|nr:hypothetical protein XF16B_45870 [Bradyrhizobium diazoefficiens]BCF70240.1 hypothetical protein XF19B_45930 [Bradyrhizobium diazoefficiens]
MSRNIAAILRTVELAKAQRVKRKHTTAPAPVAPVDEDAESYARFSDFITEYETFDLPDCKAVTPGLVPVSRRAEPKSIHDPAPRARIAFEKPRKRRPRDPYATGKDCELPEYRQTRTVTVEDASGRARGVIQINPFSKRITIGGFGLTTKART